MASKAQLKIEIPLPLLAKLEPIIKERGLTVSEVCGLYLRSLVTTSERNRALDLDSEMPLGKFKGEQVGVVIRAEPRYVAWLLGTTTSFKLGPEALQLLEDTFRRLDEG